MYNIYMYVLCLIFHYSDLQLCLNFALQEIHLV